MLSKDIVHCGDLPRSHVPGVLQDAILLSLDVLPACPNTVAEALSSGVPVIGFNTGAMQELVVQKAGELADYEGNPWKLEKPNFANMWDALVRVWSGYPEYCIEARRHAEQNYDVRMMTKRYVAIFEAAVDNR
jgi:glycosyltransferase involved in cell wall biosynthesis